MRWRSSDALLPPPPSPELRSQRGLRGAEGLSGVPIRSVGAGRGGGWRGWGPPALRDPPGRRERRSVVLAVVVVEEGGVPVGQGAVLRRLLFLLRVVRLLPVAPLILHHLQGGGGGGSGHPGAVFCQASLSPHPHRCAFLSAPFPPHPPRVTAALWAPTAAQHPTPGSNLQPPPHSQGSPTPPPLHPDLHGAHSPPSEPELQTPPRWGL